MASLEIQKLACLVRQEEEEEDGQEEEEADKL
jgi:hypothetical protein